MKCSSCGTEDLSGLYCSNCGAKLIEYEIENLQEEDKVHKHNSETSKESDNLEQIKLVKPIAKNRFCSKCRSLIPDGEDFCPKCTSNYKNIPMKQNSLPMLFALIGIITFCLFFVASCVSSCNSSSVNQPKRFEDMTNKEYQDFRKWESKQNQQKWENEKAFK